MLYHYFYNGFIAILKNNKNPALAVILKRFYGPVLTQGGCLPKYSWVSYINASIHAIFRGRLPFPNL